MNEVRRDRFTACSPLHYNLTPKATRRFGLILMNGPTASGRILKNVINSLSKEIDSKVFMMGFSVSVGFMKHFAKIHPNRIKAAAIGGIG